MKTIINNGLKVLEYTDNYDVRAEIIKIGYKEVIEILKLANK